MPSTYPTQLDLFPSAAMPAAATLHAHTLATDAHSTLHATLGQAVAALEAKLGIDASAVPTSIDARIAAVESQFAQLRGGWFVDPGVWTRIDGNHFSVTGPVDRRGDFYTGLKLRWTDNNGVKYGVVYASSVAGVTPNIVTTVELIPTDDFTIDLGMSSNPGFTSPASAPQGFPGLFGWAPGLTTTGTAINKGTGVHNGRWRCEGKLLHIEEVINWGSGGAGGSGTYRILIPVASRAVGNFFAAGVANMRAGGAGSGHEFMGTVQLSGSNFVNVQCVQSGWLSMAAMSATQPGAFGVAGDFIHVSAAIPLP